MNLDRYSIDDAAKYLNDQLDQGFTREHVLLLGSNGELAVGTFTDDGRPIFLSPREIDRFRSESENRLPVVLTSGAFRTAKEVLAGVHCVKPSDRHPDGVIDGFLDTFPRLEHRIYDIKALSIPAEELERYISVQLERRDVPAREDGATELVIEEVTGDIVTPPNVIAREAGNQENQDPEKDSSSSTENVDQSPLWVLQEAGGGMWRCGLEDAPKLINGTEGLVDLRYAVLGKGEYCDPLEYFANSESDIETARALKSQSSPAVMDEQTRKEVQDAIGDLEVERDAAQASDDIEKAQEIQAQLDRYRPYLKEATKPGGQSRRLTAGDPRDRATKAMRGRKGTVLKNLRSAGLNDMAADIEENYVLRTRSFAYLGSSLKAK